MVVCKFFQQGHCRFGDDCRFDHLRSGGGGGRGQPSNNRFSALNNENSGHGGRGFNQANPQNRTLIPYNLDPAVIKADLTVEKPIWTLSAYGPGKAAPLQLFGGYPREQSFEELRIHHYLLASQGHLQQAVQNEQKLFSDAEQQMQQALTNTDAAVKYIVDGERQHPNRIDICSDQVLIKSTVVQLGQPQPPAQTNFGQSQAPAASAIGTSGPVAPSSAFGQTQLPGASPSPFGGPGANPFIKSPSPFGAPASAVGPTFGSNPFVASTASANPNPFGQPEAPAVANPFSQASTSQSTGFGQRPVASGTAIPSVPSFGAPEFRAPSQANTNSFNRITPSQPSGLEVTAQPVTSSFGHVVHTQASGLGRPTSQPDSKPLGGQKDNYGKLVSWNGKQVRYIADVPCFQGHSGEWQKISFPDGPPQFRKTEELTAETSDTGFVEAFKYARLHGEFKNEIMPMMAPTREMCSWDF